MTSDIKRKLAAFGSCLAICVAVGGLLATAGCATPQPGTQDARNVSARQAAGAIPDWYLTLPQEPGFIHAAGTAQSSDLQLAMDKAVLSAKRNLADQINGHISSKMKEFVSETGTAESMQVVSEIERVTTNLITEVNLAGYSQPDAKVVTNQGLYRAYVLVRYPTNAADAVLVEEVQKNQVIEARLRASEAFKELEKEIQAARGK